MTILRHRLTMSSCRLRQQQGFAFISVLLALLIAAALYFGYFKMQGSGNERSTGIAAINTSRSVACRTNRQTIEREIAMWEVDHPNQPPTIAALEASGLRVPSCPEGGHYDIAGREVHCSLHK